MIVGLGNRLKELRVERGISQKNIASELGISVSCYAGYEQGYRNPDLETLVELADFFYVSTDFLLGREND